MLDKPKKSELWQIILSSQVPGQIRNVFTKKDCILLLFSITEVDSSLGRSAVFEKNAERYRNFDSDEGQVMLVEQRNIFTFRLSNFNIWSLAAENIGGVGHMSYS